MTCCCSSTSDNVVRVEVSETIESAKNTTYGLLLLLLCTDDDDAGAVLEVVVKRERILVPVSVLIHSSSSKTR